MRSLSLLICFCDDTDKLTTLIDSSCDVLMDERIPIDNGLALISLLANISFKLKSEALLARGHKKSGRLLQRENYRNRSLR